MCQLISSSSPSLSSPSSSISSSMMIPFIAISSIGRFLNSAASVSSLNTRSNLLLSMQSGRRCFFALGQGGGGNSGSTAILHKEVITCNYLLYCILYHCRDQPGKIGGRELKAGVCVDLNQPGFHFFINHEIVAKDLNKN